VKGLIERLETAILS